ncbi:hypothetical protein GcC1_097005 [Golovinomyces cichoracearum]|uniref:DUF7707 domain-containing protein n=1 Tax=Golovinomyces cichoracearum TaxID=62708 RepID=A0A420IAJ3_9PEZI|nr:hypothetical protein GcC1_097005 [Golovinomyces cichoracearum]
MHSFKFSLAVGVLAHLLMSVNSQATYSIEPSSVSLSIRKDSWCSSQTTSCPILCMQYPGQSSTTADNRCDPKTLTFSCVCENGLSPNASEFSQTLPFFVCQEYGNQCVAACDGDTLCQGACREDHPCGAQNPTRVNATSTSVSASHTETSTSGVAYSGLAGSSGSGSSDSNKSGSVAALYPVQGYISAIIFASMFLGFAIMM